MATADWPKFRSQLFKWGGFGVFVSILPIGLTYLQRLIDKQPHDIVEIIANGELVLVSAVLSAGSLGELLNRSRKTTKINLFEQLIILAAAASLFGGGWFYSTLSANSESRAMQADWSRVEPAHIPDLSHAGDADSSAWLSGAAFGLMLVVGVSSIYIMSLEDG